MAEHNQRTLIRPSLQRLQLTRHLPHRNQFAALDPSQRKLMRLANVDEVQFFSRIYSPLHFSRCNLKVHFLSIVRLPAP